MALRPLVKDRADLKYALVEFLGIDAATYDQNEIVLALQHAGVETFQRHFVTLSEESIMDLELPATGTLPVRPLQLMKKTQLRILIAFYHFSCKYANFKVKIKACTKVAFDDFRTTAYNPEEKIVPFVPNKGADYKDDEVANWKKSMRPSAKDFKEFKEDVYWQKAKESIETTLEAQGLSHLIDINYVPTSKECDDMQTKWLYKVFTDILKAPSAKSIVTLHLKKRNTRKLWRDLCHELDMSMTAEIRSQEISSYLSSTRLSQSGWRGTTEGFLLHWCEQARLYNEINPKSPYSDEQLIRFMSTCVMDTDGLRDVLNLHRTAQKAAKKPTKLSFHEYIALLQQPAQVKDSANKSHKNPRFKRSVNSHQFVFDDDDGNDGYETNTHDINTDIRDLTVMQMDSSNNRGGSNFRNNNSGSGPRYVKMNRATWDSLSQDDQKAWDAVTDDGKSKILKYVANRVSSYPVDRRTVNNHDIIFEEDNDNEGTEVKTHETDGKTFVGTHEINVNKSSPSPATFLIDDTENHLVDDIEKNDEQHDTKNLKGELKEKSFFDMMTTKTTEEEYSKFMSASHVLSQPSKKNPKISANMARSDFTPECHVREHKPVYPKNYNFNISSSDDEDPKPKRGTDDRARASKPSAKKLSENRERAHKTNSKKPSKKPKAPTRNVKAAQHIFAGIDFNQESSEDEEAEREQDDKVSESRSNKTRTAEVTNSEKPFEDTKTNKNDASDHTHYRDQEDKDSDEESESSSSDSSSDDDDSSDDSTSTEDSEGPPPLSPDDSSDEENERYKDHEDDSSDEEEDQKAMRKMEMFLKGKQVTSSERKDLEDDIEDFEVIENNGLDISDITTRKSSGSTPSSQNSNKMSGRFSEIDKPENVLNKITRSKDGSRIVHQDIERKKEEKRQETESVSKNDSSEPKEADTSTSNMLTVTRDDPGKNIPGQDCNVSEEIIFDQSLYDKSAKTPAAVPKKKLAAKVTVNDTSEPKKTVPMLKPTPADIKAGESTTEAHHSETKFASKPMADIPAALKVKIPLAASMPKPSVEDTPKRDSMFKKVMSKAARRKAKKKEKEERKAKSKVSPSNSVPSSQESIEDRKPSATQDDTVLQGTVEDKKPPAIQDETVPQDDEESPNEGPTEQVQDGEQDAGSHHSGDTESTKHGKTRQGRHFR